MVSGQNVSQLDVFIQGEQISALGDLANLRADVEINAEDLLVLPGALL